MSRRPPPTPRPVAGSGVFKNLFDAKPEFPLKDGHPPQRPSPVEVGAPFSVQGVRSFELVATFEPYELIPDAEKVILNGGYSGAPQAPQAPQGPSVLGPDMQDFLQQTLANQARLPPLADSASVLRIRVRRIVDTDARVGMAGVIRAFVESKVRPFLGEAVWSKMRYAYREIESTCSPILSEYVMMWCSTDQESSDQFVNLVLDIQKPSYENPVEAFFRVLFGSFYRPDGTRVDPEVVLGASNESTKYTSTVSMQTKWNLNRPFVRPILRGGRLARESTLPVEVFAAREFTARPGQAASGQRQRLA